MRLFFALARRAAQRQLTYRAATVAGLLTNLFFGLLRATVLTALYGEQQTVMGLSRQDVVTYTGLSQAMIAYVSLFGWYDLMNTVTSGEIAGDLLKPLPLFRFWLAQDLGRAVVAFVLRGLFILAAYALVVEVTWPRQWPPLLLALLLGWLVSFAWRFLINLAAFWTPDARGVGRFAFGVALILSGFFMPLRFYPDWFVTLCNFTPFPLMVNTSVEIYFGLLTGPALVRALLIQLGWAVGLIALCHLVLRAGVRRLVIQGG
jgi:ABC-2 type transport system permease protein